MLFHNRHTITIGRLARLLDSHDLALVKRVRVWLPRYLLARAFNRLMTELAETLNKSALEKEIESGILKTKIYNKAYNLYPALVDIVSISWDAKYREKVKDLTGIELNRLEDRDVLIQETKRLQDKYKELAVEQNKGDGVSFAQVIISTEIVLDLSISRDTLLYEFQYYMNAASEKLRQLEKANG